MSATEAALISDVHREAFRRAAFLASFLMVLTFVFIVAASALDVANARAQEALGYAAPIGFAVVGFILATKRGRNPLGWLMLLAGLGPRAEPGRPSPGGSGPRRPPERGADRPRVRCRPGTRRVTRPGR